MLGIEGRYQRIDAGWNFERAVASNVEVGVALVCGDPV